MTSIPIEERDGRRRAEFRLWNCDSCRCVHLRAADVLLTFTREEYAAFAHAVAECYFGGGCSNSAPEEFAQPLNITEMVN